MQKKMIFRLDQDTDGWPPVTAESVWVTARDDGRFVVGNIPFFATEATLDDVVEATWKDGELRYVTTAESSGNSLLRVIYPRGTDPGEARKGLETWAARRS